MISEGYVANEQYRSGPYFLSGRPSSTATYSDAFADLIADAVARTTAGTDDWLLKAFNSYRAPARTTAGTDDWLLKAFSSYRASAPNPYADFIKALQTKRKVFISYHHGSDRAYYEEFSRVFADTYESCHDNSVNREIDSDDFEYVIRSIRERFLTGTSCTIVLCGPHTRWRKFVDWEIKATLDKQHGLIGINLPLNPRDLHGQVHKPDRLQDNLDSGYALWRDWDDLVHGGAATLRSWIAAACSASSSNIKNSRPLRQQNG